MELVELISESAWSWTPVICTAGCVLVGAGGCIAICAIDGPLSIIADAQAFHIATASKTAVGAIIAGFAD